MVTWMFHGMTEASTLGWAPGEWPETVEVTLPTGQAVTFTKNGPERDSSGRFVGYDYRYCAPGTKEPDGRLVVTDD